MFEGKKTEKKIDCPSKNEKLINVPHNVRQGYKLSPTDHDPSSIPGYTVTQISVIANQKFERCLICLATYSCNTDI